MMKLQALVYSNILVIILPAKPKGNSCCKSRNRRIVANFYVKPHPPEETRGKRENDGDLNGFFS